MQFDADRHFCGHRQSVDTNRAGRREADADRPDGPRHRVRADAAYVDAGLNIVHVDDVAAGHLLAFHRGEPVSATFWVGRT